MRQEKKEKTDEEISPPSGGFKILSKENLDHLNNQGQPPLLNGVLNQNFQF